MTAAYIPVNDEQGAELLQSFKNPAGPGGEQVHAEGVVIVDQYGNPFTRSYRLPIESDAARDVFARQKISIDSNQVEVPYDDTNWATFVDQSSSGGAPAANQAGGQVTISSGTGANGTRNVLSKDTTKYRLGHEVGWGGTAVFGQAVGVANATVWWGPTDDLIFTNAVILGQFDGPLAVRYRRGGATVWTKPPDQWLTGWEAEYGATFDPTKAQVIRIRAGLYGQRGFVVELASPIPGSDGATRWVPIIDHTNINSASVAVFTNNDLKVGMGVIKSGADATNLSISSSCQAGWSASDEARISDVLSDRTLASRVVAALVGRTNAGAWVGVNVNSQGRLFVTNDSVGVTGAAVPASATLVGGSDNGTLRAAKVDSDGTQVVRELTRSRGDPLTAAGTVTSSAPLTVAPGTAGNAIRLFWITAGAEPAGGVYPLITVTLPSATDPTRVLYKQYAISHAEMFTGAADASLTVSVSGSGTIAATVHYEEFTPP